MLSEEENLDRFDSVNDAVEIVKFEETITDKIQINDIVVLKISNQILFVTHTNYELDSHFEFAGLEETTGHTCLFNREDVESINKQQSSENKTMK